MKKRWMLSALVMGCTCLFADQDFDMDNDPSPDEQFGAVDASYGSDDIANEKQGDDCQGPECKVDGAQ